MSANLPEGVDNPSYFGLGGPWRVRQPDGEIVGWDLTEEQADQLARAWPGDVAEPDPLGVRGDEPYPPPSAGE